MEFSKVIKERYSVRDFDSRIIEDEKLNLILNAGLLAPTAKNQQPIKIYVVKSEQAILKIRDLTPCHYNAPVVLIGCYDKLQVWKNDLQNKTSGEQDISIAMTHIMLEAYNQGIGSCWVNMLDADKLKTQLNLPENIIPVLLMPIGYASKNAMPSQRHSESKPKEQIYEEL